MSKKNTSQKCCECEKVAVVIDEKKYYCALHYCYKYKIPTLKKQ